MCSQTYSYELYAITSQNIDKPKRRQPKRRQTETSTKQNVDKPKRRQTKTSTNQNVDGLCGMIFWVYELLRECSNFVSTGISYISLSSLA